jgi:hypothetical protein
LHGRYRDRHGERCGGGADAVGNHPHQRQQFEPEEIEKKKEKIAQRDKGDNSAELVNERQEKATQKEERKNWQKSCF